MWYQIFKIFLRFSYIYFLLVTVVVINAHVYTHFFNQILVCFITATEREKKKKKTNSNNNKDKREVEKREQNRAFFLFILIDIHICAFIASVRRAMECAVTTKYFKKELRHILSILIILPCCCLSLCNSNYVYRHLWDSWECLVDNNNNNS